MKPEKAAMIENMLIQMARTGQIGGKVMYINNIGFFFDSCKNIGNY